MMKANFLVETGNIILLVLVIVIIVGVSGYFIYRAFKKDRAEMKEAEAKAKQRSQERAQRRNHNK